MSLDRNMLSCESPSGLLDIRAVTAPPKWDVTKTATTRKESYEVRDDNKKLKMDLFGWDEAGPDASFTMSHNDKSPTKKWEIEFNAPKPTKMWSVKSYAHAVQGWTWANSFTPNSGFPIKHSKSLSKKVVFAFKSDPANKVAFNAMVAAYGHHQEGGAKDPKKDGGANWEIMIWGDYSGEPKGELVKIGGKEYYMEVNRARGEEFTNWVYRAKNKTQTISVDIGDFMRHAQVDKKEDGTQRDTWLSNVTAGFELYNGSGKFTVNNFTVK